MPQQMQQGPPRLSPDQKRRVAQLMDQGADLDLSKISPEDLADINAARAGGGVKGQVQSPGDNLSAAAEGGVGAATQFIRGKRDDSGMLAGVEATALPFTMAMSETGREQLYVPPEGSFMPPIIPMAAQGMVDANKQQRQLATNAGNRALDSSASLGTRVGGAAEMIGRSVMSGVPVIGDQALGLIDRAFGSGGFEGQEPDPLGAAGEGLVAALPVGFPRIGRFQKPVVPMTFGQRINPALRALRSGTMVMESFLEKTFGGTALRATRAAAKERTIGLAQQAVDSISAFRGPDPVRREFIAATIKRSLDQAKATGNQLYDALDAATGSAPIVDFSGVKARIGAVRQELMEQGAYSPQVEALLARAEAHMAPAQTFKQARATRSAWNEYNDPMNPTPGSSDRIKTEIGAEIDRAMEAAATAAGVERQWRAANSFWRESVAEPFYATVTKRILKDPALMEDMLPLINGMSLDELRILERAAGPEGFATLRQGWAQHLLNKHITGEAAYPEDAMGSVGRIIVGRGGRDVASIDGKGLRRAIEGMEPERRALLLGDASDRWLEVADIGAALSAKSGDMALSIAAGMLNAMSIAAVFGQGSLGTAAYRQGIAWLLSHALGNQRLLNALGMARHLVTRPTPVGFTMLAARVWEAIPEDQRQEFINAVTRADDTGFLQPGVATRGTVPFAQVGARPSGTIPPEQLRR